MKKVLFFLLIAVVFAANANAETFKSSILKTDETGLLTYDTVIQLDNMTKEVIYNKMKLWILANIKSGDVNTFFDDKNFETIITSPTIAIEDLKYRHLHDQKVTFKVVLLFKDGKMKIQTNTFNYFGIELSGKLHTEPLQDISLKHIIPNPYPRLEDNFDQAFSSFIMMVANAAKSSKKDNW